MANTTAPVAFQDDYYPGTVGRNARLPAYAKAQGFVDAKIRYRFNDRLTVSFEGKNLRDESVYFDCRLHPAAQ